MGFFWYRILLLILGLGISTQSCSNIARKEMFSEYSKKFKRRFLDYFWQEDFILRINATNSSFTVPELLFTQNDTNTIMTQLDNGLGIIVVDNQGEVILSKGYGDEDKYLIPIDVKRIANGYGILGYLIDKITDKQNIFFIKTDYNWTATSGIELGSMLDDSVGKFIWEPLDNKYIIPISTQGRNSGYDNLGILTLNAGLTYFDLNLWSYKGNQYPVETIIGNSNNAIIAGNTLFVDKNFFLLRFNHNAVKPNKFVLYTAEGDNIINSFKKLQNQYFGVGYYNDKINLYDSGWLMSLSNSFNVERSLRIKSGDSDIVLYDHAQYNNSIVTLGYLAPNKLLLLALDKNLTMCLVAKMLENYRDHKMYLSQVSDTLYATAFNLKNEAVFLSLQNIYDLQSPFENINITLEDITSRIEARNKYMKNDIPNYFDGYNYSIEPRNILFNTYINYLGEIPNIDSTMATTTSPTTTTPPITTLFPWQHYNSTQATELANASAHEGAEGYPGQTYNILNLNDMLQLLIGAGLALLLICICLLLCKCIGIRRKQLHGLRSNELYNHIELTDVEVATDEPSKEDTTNESSSLIKEPTEKESLSTTIPKNDFINIADINQNFINIADINQNLDEVKDQTAPKNGDNASTGSSDVSSNSINPVHVGDIAKTNMNASTPLPPQTDSSTLESDDIKPLEIE